MENYFIKENSVGKAWQEAMKTIIEKGTITFDDNKKLHEILGLHIKIAKPSESDTIIEKKGDKDMIEWMKKNFFSKDKVLNWGYSYGKRITDYLGINQLENIKQKLLNNINSKSATISLNNPSEDKKHSPCINILDFKVRNNTVILNTFFRSQDICKKMYADAICLTLILNDLARTLKIKNTELNLYIMSAHIYENDLEKAQEIINA